MLAYLVAILRTNSVENATQNRRFTTMAKYIRLMNNKYVKAWMMTSCLPLLVLYFLDHDVREGIVERPLPQEALLVKVTVHLAEGMLADTDGRLQLRR